MVTTKDKKLLHPDISVHVHDFPQHKQQKFINRPQDELIRGLNKKKL